MVNARYHCNIIRVGEHNMELGQKASLRRIKVTHYVLVALLFDKLKNGELFLLAQYVLRLRY